MIKYVDASAFTSKRELHDAMKKALGEENYIGNNLDALHDCLTSICEPTTLVINNWGSAVRNLGEYSRILWSVLDDSTNENDGLKIILN